MRVMLNGEPQTFPDDLTVADLIVRLGLNQRRVAIEVNRQIIARATYAACTITENDEVEIVHFVGGG